MEKYKPRKVGRFYRHADAVLVQHVREKKEKSKIYDSQVINGVLTRVERVKPVNEGLKYNDFCIGALIESGNVNLLKQVKPIASSNLDNADRIGETLSNLNAE